MGFIVLEHDTQAQTSKNAGKIFIVIVCSNAHYAKTFSLLSQVSMIVVGVYVTIHSLFLFVHVATLSVAVNSADNALLTLLISGNFAEIKSTVFKKYNKQNL